MSTAPKSRVPLSAGRSAGLNYNDDNPFPWQAYGTTWESKRRSVGIRQNGEVFRSWGL